MNRIKSIDGLRAISIIMVLLAHGSETMPPAIGSNWFYQFFGNGSLGVRIFFVISGYLITKLLIIEQNKYGKINLKNFYLRRIFRIFPVFYLYIAVLILLKIFVFPDIFNTYKTIAIAGVYLWNYGQFFHNAPDAKGAWFLGHFWSLAMEEQFYLVWPVTFLLVKNKIKLRNIVLGIIILMPFLRVLTYVLVPITRGQIILMLQTGGDTILIGCLGALLESEAGFKEKFSKFYESKIWVGAALLFMFILSPLLVSKFTGTYNLTVGLSLTNVCIIVVLFWATNVPSTFANVLNTKTMVQIGILSYSIYIWQQLFLTTLNDTWFNKFPQNIAVVFLVAFISYYVIERPILRLKRHLKN